MQSTSEVEPSASWYLPAGQSQHIVVETAENFPVLHLVHETAPGKYRVLVIDPGLHNSQAIIDLLEYHPAPHGTHLTLPESCRVSVIEPPSHNVHDAASAPLK
jgi:hypothetical protein